MRRLDMRVVMGLLLVCLGGIFLLQNFAIIPANLPLLWVTVFVVSGLVFLYSFFRDVLQWWPLIPGLASLGLAALIGLPSLVPGFPGAAGVAIFFGMIGLSFVAVFLITATREWWALIPGFAFLGLAFLMGMPAVFPELDAEIGVGMFLGMIGLAFLMILLVMRGREWWPLIPGGALVSVALMIALAPFLPGEAAVGLMMVGLALTFSLVALLAPHERPRRWALIPAGILGLIGVLFIAAATRLAGYVLPAALILGGAYIIFRSTRVDRR